MKGRIKMLLALAAMAVTTFVAATSAYACWIFVIHQRECPKSLIETD